MEGYKCEFCEKILKTISSLNHHIKTAKRCLSLRKDTTKEEFTCEFCTRKFTCRHYLISHLASCTQKKAKDSQNRKY